MAILVVAADSEHRKIMGVVVATANVGNEVSWQLLLLLLLLPPLLTSDNDARCVGWKRYKGA